MKTNSNVQWEGAPVLAGKLLRILRGIARNPDQVEVRVIERPFLYTVEIRASKADILRLNARREELQVLACSITDYKCLLKFIEI